MAEWVQTLLQAVSMVGFPIVVALIALYIIYKQGKQHTEEMGKVRESIENNTLALSKLIDKLELLLGK